MADLLASSRFSELDIENLVEEVRDLSKRERDRLLSSLRLILHHLLKFSFSNLISFQGFILSLFLEYLLFMKAL